MQPELLKPEIPKPHKIHHPKEWKLVALRDDRVRVLKIEADGDSWKGLIKPKIRLMGRWLEQAGFSPGSHVHVTCVAPGIIELRSGDTE